MSKERVGKISKFRKSGNEDWKVQLEQLQMGLKIIESEAASIPEKYGMTRESLEAFLANPSNFSPSDWQLLEEAKEKSQQLKRELTEILHIQQKEDKPHKKKYRKSPVKKNWIPLQ